MRALRRRLYRLQVVPSGCIGAHVQGEPFLMRGDVGRVIGVEAGMVDGAWVDAVRHTALLLREEDTARLNSEKSVP